MEEKFKFGSEELKKEIEGNFAKFAVGIPTNIEVVENQEFEKRVSEFTKDGETKIITKYDIAILIEAEPKVWSVSKKVLNTINEHIEKTTKFKVILRETQYEVIPLGLKD